MSLRIRSPQLREYLEEKLDQLSYSSDTGAYTIDGDLTVTGSISQAGSAVAVETSYYAALTVGLDDEGYDVKFFGATSGKYWLWDESEDEMVIKGTVDITGATAITGALTQTGAATVIGALTVGVNDTGHDVKFYGATSGSYWMWDESGDDMIVVGDSQFTGAVTVGVDDTGHDVKFYGATASSYLLWDESGDMLVLDAADLKLGDADILIFGDGSDVQIRWDATDLDVLGVADDQVIKIGNGTNSFDLWVYGNTANDNIIFDASGNTLNLDGIDLQLEDSDILSFGDADDVQIRWDGTDLDILAAADASIIKFGNGTADFDIWIYAGSNTVVFNEGDSKAVFDGYDIQLNDADELRFGDLAAGDIVMNFDGTNFEIEGAAAATSVLVGAAGKVLNTTLHGSITVGVDDTGYDVKFFGATAGAYMLWDESADELVFATGASIDLTADEVMIDFKAGTSSTATIGTTVPAGWINVAVAGTTVYIPYWTVDGA